MNERTQVAIHAGTALAVNDDDIVNVLANSLYPGAKPESCMMVLAYCRAASLDPMLKPVHIMQVSVKQGDDYIERDVVMPGVGLYRTLAARTGEYAGMDEPQFGPTKTFTYKRKVTTWATNERGKRVGNDSYVDAMIKYPEWCRVTVYRLVGGMRCAFSAIEFWLENYGTASRYTDAPNTMWAKRPSGQLAKCAEAQALRKAFPESVGAEATAEEMEGKHFDTAGAPDGAPVVEGKFVTIKDDPEPKRELPAYSAEWFEKKLPDWRGHIQNGRRTAEDIIEMLSKKWTLSDEQQQTIRAIKTDRQGEA